MSAPDIASVRISPLVAIPSLLEEYADEPYELIFAQAGVDPTLFEDPENSISFNSAGRLLKTCAEHTGLPHFGLLVGQQTSPETLGKLGEMGIHAQNVGAALNSMIQRLCVHDRGSIPTLTSSNGFAKFGYAVYVPVPEGIQHIYNVARAVNYNLLRAMLGNTWTPSQVSFSISEPVDRAPYQTFLGAPLVFEADEDAIVFPDHLLHLPLATADEKKFELLKGRVEIAEEKVGVDFLEKVRSILRPTIISKTCSPERIAQLLSMHPRTLNRRFNDEGTTLREMVGELRYEIARQMLSESDLQIISISNMLGYADASIFTRAFQRWSGITPSDWRNTTQQV